MISKSAVKKFLSRDLDEFDWIKSESQAALRMAINEMPVRPHFHTKPFHHQLAAFLIGAHQDDFLFFLDMGLGKTKLMLDLFRFKRNIGKASRALVIVPQVTNIASWGDEIGVHSPDFTHLEWLGSTKERLQELPPHKDIYIINYDGLVRLCCVNNTGKLRIDKKAVEALAAHFDFLVLDESQNIKNWKSLRYKAISELAKNMKCKYALTGTPFGRNPQDLWAQFKVIDGGYTLGPTLGIFREAFFEQKFNGFAYDYKLTKRGKDDLHRIMKHKSLYYQSEECMDLPSKVYIPTRVSFPQDAQDYYKTVVQEVIDSNSDLTAMDNAFMRMRQLTSGFMNYKDEDGEKLAVDFPDNPKLDALAELILDLPEDEQFIIFYEFNYSGAKISEFLTTAKISHSRLWSGTPDKAKAIRDFTSGKARGLLANSKSGGTGLNLQNARYCFFYETPVSPIIRQQAEKRCHRAGQESSHVFYYDLIVVNSIDEKILGFLKEGKDLFDSLIKGRSNKTAMKKLLGV